MGNRRFSVTTGVLVGISLVALYFVGKTVNPPPPAPPKEQAVAKPAPPPPTPAETAAQQKTITAQNAQEAKNRAETMKRMAAQAKAKPVTPASKFNPTAIDTDADYWHHNDMGAKGEAEMAAKVAAANAKLKAQPSTPKLQTAKPTLPGP